MIKLFYQCFTPEKGYLHKLVLIRNVWNFWAFQHNKFPLFQWSPKSNLTSPQRPPILTILSNILILQFRSFSSRHESYRRSSKIKFEIERSIDRHARYWSIIDSGVLESRAGSAWTREKSAIVISPRCQFRKSIFQQLNVFGRLREGW